MPYMLIICHETWSHDRLRKKSYYNTKHYVMYLFADVEIEFYVIFYVLINKIS